MTGWPEAAYNGDYIAEIAGLPRARHGARPTTAVHRLRRHRRPGRHPPVRGGLPAARAGPGPAGLRRALRPLFPGVQPLRQRPRRAAVKRLVDGGDTYEKDGALWLRSTDYGDDKDRVMRKSDGGYTYFVPDVAYHIHKFERGFAQGHQRAGQRPPRHDRARARRAAGGAPGHPAGLPRLPAAQDGDGDARRPGGEDLQARRQLRHAARPDRLDQPRRGALLPDQPQGRHRVRLRRRPGAEGQRREPGVLRAVRACAHLLGAGAMAARGWNRPTCRC